MVGGANVNRQDRGGVRSAQDLERKYPLKDLVGMKKAVKQNEYGLIKTDKMLEDFMKATLQEMGDLKSQIAGNITTYFYSGVPTMDKPPVTEWQESEYETHLGDLYYDRDTGTGYRFVIVDGVYRWDLASGDINEVLDIANQAKDTADGKRRVFLETPIPPYDEGDLWLNKRELYVCISPKPTDGKYNSGDFDKATKYTDDTALQTFVDTTYAEAIKSLNAQIDSKVTTWYANGEPTLENAPAVDWTTDELKEAHVGDMYYDKDTGFAYRYTFEEDMYKWSLIRDRDTIEALAVANSASDTADGKRRVFTGPPYPPYDNGDLWFDSADIYICQVSKSALNDETGEAEVYAEGDFIIATKYTDDTVANQVGDNLQVLQGTVLNVIESANQFKAEVHDRDEKTQAAIDLINESLKTLIKGANGQSLMTQTENGWEFNIESLLNTVDGMSSVLSYMKVYEVDGEPHLELGTSNNGFKSVHSNKGIRFMIGDTTSAFIDYNALNIEKAIINEELQVGGFLLKERANGNVGFVWRGEDD